MLTADRVDLAASLVTTESLEARSTGGAAPAEDAPHGARRTRAASWTLQGRGKRLWPWSRMTGWRAVHAVMVPARLDGPHASPKGLRHVLRWRQSPPASPLNLAQKWLDHAQLTTAAAYTDADGAEEKDIAQRIWR